MVLSAAILVRAWQRWKGRNNSAAVLVGCRLETWDRLGTLPFPASDPHTGFSIHSLCRTVLWAHIVKGMSSYNFTDCLLFQTPFSSHGSFFPLTYMPHVAERSVEKQQMEKSVLASSTPFPMWLPAVVWRANSELHAMLLGVHSFAE